MRGVFRYKYSVPLMAVLLLSVVFCAVSYGYMAYADGYRLTASFMMAREDVSLAESGDTVLVGAGYHDVVKEAVEKAAEPAPTLVVTKAVPSSADYALRESEDIVYAWLRKAGFSRAAVSGIMGNFYQEHRFSTSDTPGGLGIAQWTMGRRAELMKRENYLALEVQLEYLVWEMGNGWYINNVKNPLLNVSDDEAGVREATLIFQNKFERCGTCREEKRLAWAQTYFARYAAQENVAEAVSVAEGQE